MTRAAIKGLASAKMDEVLAFDSTELVPHSLLDTIMNSECLTFLLECPTHLLPATPISTTGAQTDVDNGTGYVLCPSDFIKLHTFKMTEWSAPVKKVITEENPEYINQRFSCLSGGIDKPVLVLRVEPDEISSTVDGRVLEYYSVVDSHSIEVALYVKETLPENLPDRLMEAFTWYLASSALAITGNDVSKAGAIVAEKKYKQIFQLNTW